MRSLVLAAAVCLVASTVSAGVGTTKSGLRYLLPEGWKSESSQPNTAILTPPNEGFEVYLLCHTNFAFPKTLTEQSLSAVADRLKVVSERVFKIKLQRTATSIFKSGAAVLYRQPGGDRVALYLLKNVGGKVAYIAGNGRADVLKRAKKIAYIAGSLTVPARNVVVNNVRQPVVNANVNRAYVGTWYAKKSTYSNGGGGYGSSTTYYMFQLNGDGTAKVNVKSSLAVSVPGGGAYGRPGAGTTYAGKWTVEKGQLTIRCTDGTFYQGKATFFNHFGKQKMKWVNARGYTLFFGK